MIRPLEKLPAWSNVLFISSPLPGKSHTHCHHNLRVQPRSLVLYSYPKLLHVCLGLRETQQDTCMVLQVHSSSNSAQQMLNRVFVIFRRIFWCVLWIWIIEDDWFWLMKSIVRQAAAIHDPLLSGEFQSGRIFQNLHFPAANCTWSSTLDLSSKLNNQYAYGTILNPPYVYIPCPSPLRKRNALFYYKSHH